MPRVRPEVAIALMFTFLPLLIAILAYRDWRTERDCAWPPPLSLVVAGGVVFVLLFGVWRMSTVP